MQDKEGIIQVEYFICISQLFKYLSLRLRTFWRGL